MRRVFDRSEGALGLQHQDEKDLGGVPYGWHDRHVVFAQRTEWVKTPKGKPVKRQVAGTYGPLSGGLCFFPTKSSGRTVSEWSFAMPAFSGPPSLPGSCYVIKGKKLVVPPGAPIGFKKMADGSHPGLEPFLPGEIVSDDSLEGLTALVAPIPGPPGWPELSFPGKMPGVLVQASDLGKQVPCFMPAGGVLVAPFFTKDAGALLGTRAFDVTPGEVELDLERNGQVSTLFRIFAHLDPATGDESKSVAFIASGLKAPTTKSKTKATKPPAGPLGHSIALRLSSSGHHATPGMIGWVSGITSVDDASHGIDTMGALDCVKGGPLNTGPSDCQHSFGTNADEEGFNPVHAGIDTVWNDPRFYWHGAKGSSSTKKDATLDFDRDTDYLPAVSGPEVLTGYIRHDPKDIHYTADGRGPFKGKWKVEVSGFTKTVGGSDTVPPDPGSDPLPPGDPPTSGPPGDPPAGPGGPGGGAGFAPPAGGGAFGAPPGGAGGGVPPGEPGLVLEPPDPKPKPTKKKKKSRGGIPWIEDPETGHWVGPAGEDGGAAWDPPFVPGGSSSLSRVAARPREQWLALDDSHSQAYRGDRNLRHGDQHVEVSSVGFLGKPQHYSARVRDARHSGQTRREAWLRETATPIAGGAHWLAAENQDGTFVYQTGPRGAKYPGGTADGILLFCSGDYDPSLLARGKLLPTKRSKLTIALYGAGLALGQPMARCGLRNAFLLSQVSDTKTQLDYFGPGTGDVFWGKPAAADAAIPAVWDEATGTFSAFGANVVVGGVLQAAPGWTVVPLGDAGINPAQPNKIYAVLPSVNRNVQLPAGTGLGPGKNQFKVKNFGPSTVTFTKTAAGDNIEGAAFLVVNAGQTIELTSDGAAGATFFKSACC